MGILFRIVVKGARLTQKKDPVLPVGIVLKTMPDAGKRKAQRRGHFRPALVVKGVEFAVPGIDFGIDQPGNVQADPAERLVHHAALRLCIFSDCFNGKFHTDHPAKTEFSWQ